MNADERARAGAASEPAAHGERDEDGREGVAARSRRRHWSPEASDEAAAALRILAVRPWLVAGRDDAEIAAVRRNLPAVREALARLGWVLVVERDLVRLRKSPPMRREAWAAEGPTPLQASWFFLLVVAAEGAAPRVGLAPLVTAARAAAAEAGLPVSHDIAERRAIVRALGMLDERGVVMQVDGDVEGFIEDENAPVLLAVHHARLVHVIANFGPGDPVEDPLAWLEQVEREPDPARRMRRRLVDDTLVHACDLDEGEADWLSRRVRGDDGAPLAMAFGLHLERRIEGAAFVVPEDAFRYQHELGPTPFPAAGTVPHAALLLCEYAALHGILGSSAEARPVSREPSDAEVRAVACEPSAAEAHAVAREPSDEQGPGPGWRGIWEADARVHVATLAAERSEGKGGWRRELAEDPTRLTDDVRALLTGLDLVRVRVREDGASLWWFSPATGRWTPPPQQLNTLEPRAARRPLEASISAAQKVTPPSDDTFAAALSETQIPPGPEAAPPPKTLAPPPPEDVEELSLDYDASGSAA